MALRVAGGGSGGGLSAPVANASLANMPANTVKSNITGASAAPSDNTLSAFGAAISSFVGNGAPQATYGLFSGGVTPVGPGTNLEVGRIRMPANKFGRRAIGMLMVAGQKNTGTTDIPIFNAAAVSNGGVYSTAARLQASPQGTAAASSGAFWGASVVGNLVDQTTVKSFINNGTASPFVNGAIPASNLLQTITLNTAASWDIVIVASVPTADQAFLAGAVFVVYDPDAVSTSGAAQPTAWQTATVGASPAAVVLDYSVSSNWYIPNTITNLQPVQVTNITDGKSDLVVVLKGGGGSGLWSAFSGAAATTQGWTFDQPGHAAPVADPSALNGTPVFVRVDNAGFNLRGTVSTPFVLTPP